MNGVSMKHKLIIGGVILGIIVLVCAAFLTTRQIEVSVLSTAWVREAQIENLIPRRYTDWQANVPSDAFDQHPYQAIRSFIHSCSKIGKVESCINIPIYGTKVDYTAIRWGYERSQVVNGADNQPIPFWPTPDYQTCADQGCERAGANTERYTITYAREDKTTFTCDVNGGMYGEFLPRQHYTLEDGAIVHIPRCDTIKLDSQ